jgi:hypothetical protein
VSILLDHNSLFGRSFGFTENGWDNMIRDQTRSITYSSIFTQFNNSQLPSNFKEKMPYYKNGMKIYNILKHHFTNIINTNYPSNLDILNDRQLVNFWKELLLNFGPFKDIGILNKKNLIEFITHSFFTILIESNLYGHINKYSLKTNSLIPKVLKETTKYNHIVNADVQTFIQSLCVVSLIQQITKQHSILNIITNITNSLDEDNDELVINNLNLMKLEFEKEIENTNNENKFNSIKYSLIH